MQTCSHSNVDTALLTGKGEPTLYPEHISNYLFNLDKYGNFPFVELQTNGINLMEPKMKPHLKTWYEMGLTKIAVSIISDDPRSNESIIGSKFELEQLARYLTSFGFSIRFSVIMIKGHIEHITNVQYMVNSVKKIGDKIKQPIQLTFRPVMQAAGLAATIPTVGWIQKHEIEQKTINEIDRFLQMYATPLLTLSHGANVYDYVGQNVCLTNCLTTTTDPEKIRQLIFYPNGRLTYDWQYKGAILL